MFGKKMIAFYLLGGLSAMLGTASPVRDESVAITRGAENPSISPDGKRIAVSIIGKIYILPAEGGEALPVTPDVTGWETHPAWSPDGRWIAYARKDFHENDLVVINMDTGGRTILHHVREDLGQIAFHPKGGNIFFLLEGSPQDSHLWSVPLSGGKARQWTHSEGRHEWSFSFSPDGEKVVFDHGRYKESDLYVMDLEDGRIVRITEGKSRKSCVSWDPSGNNMVFLDSDDGMEHVVIMPAKGGPEKRIHSSPYDHKNLALCPGGSSAVLCAGRLLFKLDLATGKRTPIPFRVRRLVPEREAPDLLIVNARLYDGTGSPTVENASIEIRKGKIVAVRKGLESETRPRDLRILDAEGRMALPGLVDNHRHLLNAEDGIELLKIGVTTIRDPGNVTSSILNFRDAFVFGLVEGPHVYACGPLLDGPEGYHPKFNVELRSPDHAAEVVQSLKGLGFDAVKVYFMLKPDVLRAVVSAARKEGLPVTGHIGAQTGWGEAIDAGINGLCHIMVWRDFWPPEKVADGIGESLDFSRDPIGRGQMDWTDIDPDGPRMAAFIQKMKEHRIGFDPTLRTYIGFLKGLQTDVGPVAFQKAREALEKMKRFVRWTYERGVLLLAGTDGRGYFDELEAYAEAGIPNKGILQAATVNGAKWLGKESEFGTLEPGKRADVVLVDGNPLKDIKDIRKIGFVIKEGRIVHCIPSIRNESDK